MSEKKRELQRDFKFKGNNFRIKKMDARQAISIAFQLKAFVPAVMAFMNRENDSFAGEGLITALSCGMPKREFYQLQNDCLSAVYQVMEAGEIAVLTANGDFITEELGTDAQTVVTLVLQSLAFNVKDFFDASFLKEFQSTIQNMMPSTAQTSTNT
jgi:hypothetical protein